MRSDDNNTDTKAESTSSDDVSIPRRFLERTVDDVIQGREPYDNEETLRALHHVRGHTQQQIAKAFGVDQSTISRAMDRHGVETRESAGKPTVNENDDEESSSATAN